MKWILSLIALVSVNAILAPVAKAEVAYPWCAYYGRFGTQATNCGFTSYRQCMATVSGIGGYCDRNPRYPARAKKKRHYR